MTNIFEPIQHSSKKDYFQVTKVRLYNIYTNDQPEKTRTYNNADETAIVTQAETFIESRQQ